MSGLLTHPYFTPEKHNERFTFRVFLGVIVVGLAAGVFTKTILVHLFLGIETVFRYSLAVFFVFYLADRVILKKRLNYLDVVILILFIVPVYSAFSAKREFGQPILMGLLAQNYLLMYLAGIFIFYLIRIRWITLESLRYSFLILGWICLVLFVLTEFFADPADYVGETEFVRSKDTKGGYFFKYFTYFITFAGLYHAVKFFFYRKTDQLLLFLPFLFFMILINNGRTDMVVFLATLALIFFKHQTFKQILVYTLYVLIGAGVTLAILITFFPTEYQILYDMYSSYFTVLLGQESEDSSATSRLLQVGVALDFLLKNPDAIAFGAGKVSAAYPVKMMELVNPVDIGLIGLIFNHGLVGMVIMYSQFVFAYNFSSKVKFAKNDMFFITLKYYMFMILVQSFFKGPLFYLPGQLIIIIGALYAYRYYDLEISWLTEGMARQARTPAISAPVETQQPPSP